ncbi:hypothetical protein Q4602_06940 [Paraglaciecola chathamensis]|uniref:hypothetical protein n=1 Tax=Paraglaciecola chathamensis TaxID=368405 RepID=UPI0026F96F65|nr:hypothetical protein [Paraglaciecola chathamensis]MDO6560079.1 hypothetical protein [Paraglaciecola chathamensis]MDO6839196.1 hypothetical protein [Paraglaciecola chathamensis]
MKILIKSVLIALLWLTSQQNVIANEDYTIDSDKILVTVVLKHQQDKSLTELQQKMDENRFWQSFPPEGTEIDSWYVMMGLGQVITVKIHPKDLRSLNLAIEKSAWGIFDTDIYPTYEFKGIAASIKAKKVASDSQ